MNWASAVRGIVVRAFATLTVSCRLSVKGRIVERKSLNRKLKISSLQQRRRRVYGKERETINSSDRTAR